MVRKGLPASIIKKYGVSKKAWRIYRGTKTSSNPRPKKKARKVKNLVRRRYSRSRRRRAKSFIIPLAPTAAILGAVARNTPAGTTIIGDIMDGNIPQLLYDLREVFAGVDANGKLQPTWLIQTYGPIVAGILIHKFIGGKPLNVNAMLARAGIPIFRI